MPSDFSLTEKCRLVFRIIFLAPWQISGSILRTLFIAWRRGGHAIKPYIAAGAIRAVMSTMAPRQIQYCVLPTSRAYRRWTESRAERAARAGRSEVQARLKVDIEPLDANAQSSLLWIGDRHKAKKVVIFYHGGGYFIPISSGHLEWCWRAYVAPGLEEGGVETAVAVLEYSLAPAARFPTQLRQAASGLSHVLAAGFRPRDVIIGGDSAGGNLAAQVLCHLIQPVPGVQAIGIAEPLGGAFLVSPLLTGRVDDSSFVENDGVDMINASIADKCRDELLGKRAEGIPSVVFPLDAEDLYFERLPTVVADLLVTVGENEVFRDQVVAFADRVRRQSAGLKMRFDLQKKAAHNFIMLEAELGENGECILAMQDWITGPLATSV